MEQLGRIASAIVAINAASWREAFTSAGFARIRVCLLPSSSQGGGGFHGILYDAGTMPNPNQAVSTPLAPTAIGPYSQAIRTGSLLFCSGQIPLDPATGDMVEGGIAAQTTRVLDN